MTSLTVSAGNPPVSVQGQWGGDQLRLVIDAEGGRIATGCADGSFHGPLKLAADGSFTVVGVFDPYQPGPQRADQEAHHAPARFSGEVRSGVMTLSILPEGASEAQVFNLRKGRLTKIVRCL